MLGATRFAIIRKVMSWAVLAALVLTLVLILKKSPAPDVVTSAAAASTAERKLQAASQAAASGEPAEVRLDTTELNSYLAQHLQLAGPPVGDPTPAAGPASVPASTAVADPQAVAQPESSIENVKIDLNGDMVKTYVIFNFHGKDLSLEIDGRLYTQDGYLKFDPVDGKFGSFPLPQSALQEAVQRMTDSPENRDKLRLPPTISDVEVQNGQLVVSYK